ncbi:putative transcriptional regulator, TetR family protein [Mycolicibacterium insubricum]|jgi:AcrR family transcriptional regulator|nr:putative transcriptional regulator, TetR family protein [Mycolicibacterium insubricum]
MGKPYPLSTLDTVSIAPEAAAVSGYEARWEQHNSERRGQIVRAAIALLEEGPADADLAMREVARRAGLAKSVVYRQFGSKDELERRMRSLIFTEFAAVLEDNLDLSDGSLREILRRTVAAVADWMRDHSRLDEFVRRGPIFESDGSLDALSQFKQRIAAHAEGIIASVAQVLHADDAPFRSVPFAVVTMVEATLSAWIRGAAPECSREDIVADLADYAWYVLDGAARAAGVEIAPDEPFASMIAALTTRAGGPDPLSSQPVEL